MTYLEAAMDIIEMYNNLAVKSANKGQSCGNHSEAVAIAVEALSIVAGMNPDSNKQPLALTEPVIGSAACSTL